MSWNCPRCSYPNPDTLTKCYKCECVRPVARHASPPIAQPAADAAAPVGRWVTRWDKSEIGMGCLIGWGAGGTTILIGFAFCLTGIGAIIGIPMVLIGLIVPFAGPFVAAGAAKSVHLEAPCPFCDLMLKIPAEAAKRGWVDCCGCKSRILINGSVLSKPNPPKNE